MAINLPSQFDLARRVSQPNPVTESPVVRQAVNRGRWKVVAELLDPRPVVPVFRPATVQFPSWTGWELFYTVTTNVTQYVSPPWDEWTLYSEQV